MIWVIRSQAFAKGSRQQVLISSQKDQRRQTGGACRCLNVEGSCELNSVISAQSMLLRQVHRAVDDLRTDWDDLILQSIMANQQSE